MNEPKGFQILYEQGPCLVVRKPPGMLTQAPPGIDSLELQVKRFLQTREAKEHNLYLAVIHRLDRPVSGALVMARHVRAAQRLAEQFESRSVAKRYWAIVAGPVEPDTGTWTDHMRKVPGEPRSEIVAPPHAAAQLAILHYKVIRRTARTSCLEIELETGRTHQIRLQAATRGHAVLGDELYGATIPFGPTTDDMRARWIALHARSLAFAHPMTREPVAVTAPLSLEWQAEWPPTASE